MNKNNDNTFVMERLVDVWGELYDCSIRPKGVITKENAYVGAKVMRGPDWGELYDCSILSPEELTWTWNEYVEALSRKKQPVSYDDMRNVGDNELLHIRRMK